MLQPPKWLAIIQFQMAPQSRQKISTKVCVVGYFPPPVTGQGLATERLASLLAEDFEVITLNLREGEDSLDLRFLSKVLTRIKAYRASGQKLANLLADHPDAIILWTSISPQFAGHFRDLLTVIPAFKPSNRVFAVVHWGKFDRLFRSVLTRTTAKRLLKHLEGIVFLNQDRAAQCAGVVPANQQFIAPNSLDQETHCSDEEVRQKIETRSSHEKLELLFLSNMIKKKGYLDVLEAARILRDQGVPAHLTLVGQWLSDLDREIVDLFIKQNNLKEEISYLGAIHDRARVKSIYLNSDIFLLPSYLIEGQPLTILEAMNAGTPVITTRLGGMVEMIHEGRNGYFVPSKDSKAIAQAVLRLQKRDRWKSFAQAARTAYLEKYSTDAVLEQWKQILD